MDKEILNGIKFAFGFFLVFSVIGIVAAIGFHTANEVLPGTFTGDYRFDGNIEARSSLALVGDNTTWKTLTFMDSNSSKRWEFTPKIGANLNDFQLNYFDGSAWRPNYLTVTKEGNIGIGTITPISKLQIGTPKDGIIDYLQIDKRTSPPITADCDEDSEDGRIILEDANNRLYICNGATRGWDYIALTE